VLADVFLFFFPTAVGIVLKNFKISFSVLDFGQRGGGECQKIKTPYYCFNLFISVSISFMTSAFPISPSKLKTMNTLP